MAASPPSVEHKLCASWEGLCSQGGCQGRVRGARARPTHGIASACCASTRRGRQQRPALCLPDTAMRLQTPPHYTTSWFHFYGFISTSPCCKLRLSRVRLTHAPTHAHRPHFPAAKTPGLPPSRPRRPPQPTAAAAGRGAGVRDTWRRWRRRRWAPGQRRRDGVAAAAATYPAGVVQKAGEGRSIGQECKRVWGLQWRGAGALEHGAGRSVGRSASVQHTG